jgi:hypothetical protein
LIKVWSYRFRTDKERSVLRADLRAFSEGYAYCRPGTMYLTAGRRVLAINAETGREIRRYLANHPVSKRGVGYRSGGWDSSGRILVTSGSK